MNDTPAVRQPLVGIELAVAAFAISLAVFMESLDLTIIGAAIPAVAGGLGVSPTEGTWSISSYAMAAAMVQPLTGWLVGRLGEVRTFVLSTLLFTIASIACGLAPSLFLLVVFRLIQGAVSGTLLPLSQALTVSIFPQHLKGLGLAINTIMLMGAPVLGPFLGGWLTDNYSWRWMFLINAPLGVLSVVLTWLLMHKSETPTRRTPIDYMGLLLLFVGVGCVQLVLDNGHLHDWFESPLIVGMSVVAILALALFGAWERYEPHPIVDFTLFRIRNYSVMVLLLWLGSIPVIGLMVLFPIWLQEAVGYGATDAGLAASAYGVGTILGALIIGPFINRLPMRSMLTSSLLLFAVGCAWQAVLPAEIPLEKFWLSRGLLGIATSILYVSAFQIVIGSVSPERLPAANGIVGFARVIGISIGTAAGVTIWDQRTDVQHALLASSLDSLRLANTTELPTQVAQSGGLQELALANGLSQIRALTQGYDDACWIFAVVFLLLIPICWIAKPPFGDGSTGIGGMH